MSAKMRPILPVPTIARADYACRLTVKVESCQPDKREVEVLCANGGAVDVARQRHQERGGVFSDGVGGIGRNAHDRKPGFVCRLEIDVVVAGAPHGENLDATLHKPLDHGTVDFGIHERACRVASVGERQSRRRQPRLEILDLVPPVVLPLERLLVIRLRVEKRNLLHFHNTQPFFSVDCVYYTIIGRGNMLDCVYYTIIGRGNMLARQHIVRICFLRQH